MKPESIYTEALIVETPDLRAESVYTEALINEAPNLQIENVYTEVLISSLLIPSLRGWGILV
jgi:hypothetical protein